MKSGSIVRIISDDHWADETEIFGSIGVVHKCGEDWAIVYVPERNVKAAFPSEDLVEMQPYHPIS